MVGNEVDSAVTQSPKSLKNPSFHDFAGGYYLAKNTGYSGQIYLFTPWNCERNCALSRSHISRKALAITCSALSVPLVAASLNLGSQANGSFPGLSFLSPATANAQEAAPQSVDDLIARMDEISHAAGAKNEEVKQLEIDLEAAQAEIDQITGQVHDATAKVNEALAQEDAYRSEVNRIASAMYRGTAIDPITNAISAENPQNALDRSAYMNVLSENTEKTLESLATARDEALEFRGEVTRAKAQAQLKQSELNERRKQLEKEQEVLKAQADQIREQVASLSPEERARWIAKNGPLDYSIDGLVGTNAIGMSALSAAMSKIGAPYSWGAIGPDAFDCSGLVYWAYQQQGMTIPRTSQAQMAGGIPVSRDELQPGDVVGYYPGATHVGIYAGDGKLVHASDYGIPVQVVSVDSMPFYGARRYQ